MRHTFASVAALAALTTAPAAMAQPRGSVCDTASAVAHVKRLTGSPQVVVVRRSGGQTLRGPAPLTPLCTGDRVQAGAGGSVLVEVHGAPVVEVGGRQASWTAPRKAEVSLAGNVWALLVDRVLPDVSRVQTQNRVKGPTGGHSPAFVLRGLSDGSAVLTRADLPAGMVLEIPFTGGLGPFEARLGGASSRAGTISLDEDTGYSVARFDITGLPAGEYSLILTDTRRGAETPVANAGRFVLSDAAAPTIDGPAPYDAAMTADLRALWLSRENPAARGLLAWNLAAAGPEGGLETGQVRRLIVQDANRP